MTHICEIGYTTDNTSYTHSAAHTTRNRNVLRSLFVEETSGTNPEHTNTAPHTILQIKTRNVICDKEDLGGQWAYLTNSH
jgi:hypothetical protein